MTPNPVYQRLATLRQQSRKGVALLVDPDKTLPDQCPDLLTQALPHADFLFVGGSLISGGDLNAVTVQLKRQDRVPVVLFPGHAFHFNEAADALLLLSLISGRNADLLIGQHVVAAPHLRRAGIEILPTGYLLVDGGRPTAVSYVSNTNPLPHDKPDLAACTALAGDMLGLKLIYLDCGSGAARAVSPEMVRAVRAVTDAPLLVGGGIRSADTAEAILRAGADVVVIGNGAEKNPGLLPRVAKMIADLNTSDVHQ